MRKFYFSLFVFFSVSSTVIGQISLTGGTYSQDFNTLSNTAGSTTNNLTITGWLMTESGGGARDNEQYAVDNGGSNTGDTYSYGTTAATDRALGALRSGTLIPLYGAFFTNNTGSTITQLSITYTGEQWRLGTAARTDQINFEYSIDATSLTTGTWTGVSALNFITPNTVTTGAKDGNAAGNRTTISSTITSLSIPNGATFYIRWTDTDASGADDGLSVDDFSITPNGGPVTPNLTINDVSLVEGSSGTTTFTFTVSLSAPAGAGGVTFDIATADGTATLANNDYLSNSLTGQTIPAGSSTYTFNVTVNGDATVEANETFFVNVTNVTGANVVDGQGQGTITNDDVTLTPIHDIQGSGNSSPIVGASVTTSGIVTGRRSNGFFLQEPDATADANPLTSEGIFVFTSAAPPAAATVGNLVQVTGTVTEFIPGTDPNSPPQTELTSPSVVQISTGNPLPTPVVLTTANTNPAGSPSQLEPFEGMRVSISSFTVVGPTGGNLNEANATSTSNGFFYGVITGIPRPFREPGIDVLDPLPSGAPATVTRFDGNPEIIGVGSNSIGNPAIDVATGAILTNLVGPLDYRSRFYTVDIDPASPPAVSNNALTFTAVPVPLNNELTIGSFNLERFYDNVNDPGGDAVLTATAYNNRLNKASLAIRNVLKTPDVLGIIEMENLSVLQTLATKINNDAVAAGDPNPNYVAYLSEGNDPGLIDVGFLVKSGRVTVNSVTQYGLTTTYINPNTGLPETLNDRPPLVLDGTFTGAACVTSNNFMVIVNHLRSLNGVDDPLDGNRVRTKRQQQAEFLANLIQTFQAANPAVQIVSVGDYNAFEFNDGYVDMIGTIKGVPTPANQVTLASPDLVNPDLVDLIDTHTPSQKYSYSFSGSAQTLDHILVNGNMNARLNRFAVARVDADFPEIIRNDANRPERISDHDAPVAYFTFPVSTPSITCPAPLTVSCASAVPAPNTASVTATDVCGTPTVTHQGDVISNQTCANRFIITRTYRATNAAGNFAECTQIITVNDVTPPTVTVGTISSCYPTVAAAEAAALAATSATDNCTGSLTETVSTVGTCSAVITVTTTDGCGNTTAVTYNTRIDNTPPTVTVGTIASCYPTVAAAEAAALAATSATDNCPGLLTEAASTAGTCSAVITVTTTDGCGNTTSVTYNTRIDNTPPVLTCPAPVTVSCASAVPAPDITSVTATDNCPGSLTVTHQGDVISSQTCANRYTITRTYRATDACGNFTNCTQIITVNDVTPPVVTCPANITVSAAAGLCSAVVTFTPTATDNCGGAVTITSVPASGSSFPVGTTTVTVTARDVCNNTSTCTFTVTVVDNLAPTIICPANITVNNDPGICGAVVNYPYPTVSDNCSLPGGTAVPLTQSTNNTTITPIQIGCQYFGGQTAENSWWRAYDLAPRNLPAGLTIKSVRMGVERITTATTVPVTVRIYTSAGAFPGGVRTLRATQTVNLSSQTNTIVTVPFTTPATVAPNAIVVVEVFVPDLLASNAAFFLGSNALGQSAPSYISAPACGITAPTDLTDVGFPDDHIILDLNGEYYINAPTLVQIAGLPRGATFPVGTTVNTYRATDASGNQSTCSFNVTVADAQAPTFTLCPPNVTRNTDAGQCYATYTPVQPTFADNCAVTTLTWVMTGATTGSSPATGINYVPATQFQLNGTTGTGLTTITYTIRDAAGNTATCVTTVRVNDAAIPVISAPPLTKFVCVGTDAVYSVTASAGTGNPLTYQWQQWNGSAWVNIAGATASTLTIPAVTFAQNTNTYRVVLTGRCSVVISDVVSLFVNPLPAVTLITSIPPSLTPSQSLNITANVSPTGGSFVWRKNGTVIGATGSLLTGLTVDDIGTYRVTYTDPNGCVSTSADVVVTGQASDKLWVYPNPNNGRFQVRFYNTPGENATVRVFDGKGAKVFEKTVVTGINYTRIDVQLNNPVPSEFYIVELVNGSGQRIGTKKIIVQQ